MKVSNYIIGLENLANDYGGFIFKILKVREAYVLAIPKRRLSIFGTDAKDNLITPKYSEGTVKRKKSEGKISSHVTLRQTGNLYSTFRIVKENGSIDFTVPNNDVTSFLSEHYSSNELFGFSPKDEEKIYNLFIKPAIEKIINPKEGIDINF